MTDQEQRAYNALQVAAEKIGWSGYQAGLRAWQKAGRKRSTYRYNPSEEHRRVVETMGQIGKTVSAEEAMAVLHEYDVFKARTTKA